MRAWDSALRASVPLGGINAGVLQTWDSPLWAGNCAASCPVGAISTRTRAGKAASQARRARSPGHSSGYRRGPSAHGTERHPQKMKHAKSRLVARPPSATRPTAGFAQPAGCGGATHTSRIPASPLAGGTSRRAARVCHRGFLTRCFTLRKSHRGIRRAPVCWPVRAGRIYRLAVATYHAFLSRSREASIVLLQCMSCQRQNSP